MFEANTEKVAKLVIFFFNTVSITLAAISLLSLTLIQK